ncbi:hypothetical protein [Burkholderia gladioli]|uniref:hypothetical protein n=1 Tax=Burkholderia gladioli TaxID=28095 RepID=UPI0016405164|nr:hypothetical protein [Burkholderia gladioli]
MADPQTVTLVMTQAAAQPVNWWVVGASSAVVSALVNGGFKWWEIYAARRDERARRAEQRAPALLNAALMLEDFAKQAAGYMDWCYACMYGWDAALDLAMTDPDALEETETDADEPAPMTTLALDLSIVPDWSTIPIATVSACRELPLALAESEAWVRGLVESGEVAYANGYAPDCQRAILYGRIAAELARQVRADIKTAPSMLAQDCAARLLLEYYYLQQRYCARPGEIELIPDPRAVRTRTPGASFGARAPCF